jgi:fructan beta-fructosidase
LSPDQNGVCGIRLAAGDGKYIIIGYEAASQQLTVNRSKTGNIHFDNQFASVSSASTRVPLQEGKLRLHAFLDKSIPEIFANDGAVVVTTRLFPAANLDGIVFFSKKGPTRIPSAMVWPLNSAWK